MQQAPAILHVPASPHQALTYLELPAATLVDAVDCPDVTPLSTANVCSIAHALPSGRLLLCHHPPPPAAHAGDDAPPGQGPDAGTAPSAAPSSDLVTASQLRAMGDLLLHLTLDMKHNGAVEKCAIGLFTLSERLIVCQQPGLSGLPHAWLRAACARVVRPGHCRDDIVRRCGAGKGS